MKKVAISRITGAVYNIVAITGGLFCLQQDTETPIYVCYDDEDFIFLINVSDAMFKLIAKTINDKLDF